MSPMKRAIKASAAVAATIPLHGNSQADVAGASCAIGQRDVRRESQNTPVVIGASVVNRLFSRFLRPALGVWVALATTTSFAEEPRKHEDPSSRLPGKVAFLEAATEEGFQYQFKTAWFPKIGYQGDRIYQEKDSLGPAATGRKLFILDEPENLACQPRPLVDAGKGLIGAAMRVSFDGETLYFSMAKEGDPFFRIYRVPVAGGEPVALTSGMFHDYDPDLLPDGRIVFSSTRRGSLEEYHGFPAACIYVMNADGSDIHPITFSMAADREPKVTSDGIVVYVHTEVYYQDAVIQTEIAKVHPDGTKHNTFLWADKGPVPYSRYDMHEGYAQTVGLIAPMGKGWKREDVAYGCPAPLPDGRVAALAAPWHASKATTAGATNYPFDDYEYGVVVSGSAHGGGTPIKPSVSLLDISALPDNRLLCTTRDRKSLGVMDLSNGKVRLFYQAGNDRLIHAPAYLGTRPCPKTIPTRPMDAGQPGATGYFYCHNVFATKQNQVDLKRIKAVRMIEGRPFAIRPGGNNWYGPHNEGISHIGNEGRELGAVPIAPDGSFFVEVPADRAVAFQAMDAEGREVINEMRWLFVRPGETRGCVGCHSAHASVPSNNAYLSSTLRSGPLKLISSEASYRYRANSGGISFGLAASQFNRARETGAIDLYSKPEISDWMQSGQLPPGRPTSVQHYLSALRSADEREKVGILERLKRIRSRAAVPALVKALEDPSQDVRSAAALALAACGDRASVPPLMNALAMPGYHARLSANIALEHLTGCRDLCKNLKVEDFQQTWSDYLRDNPWEKIEQKMIAQLADSDPANVILAVQTLGHIGGDAGRQALRDYLAKALDIKDKTDLCSLVEACLALGHLRDDAALDLLDRIATLYLEKHNQVWQAKDQATFPYSRIYVQETRMYRLRDKLYKEPSGNSEPQSETDKLIQSNPWKMRAVKLTSAAIEGMGWIGGQESEARLVRLASKLMSHHSYNESMNDQGGWLTYNIYTSPLHYRLAEALDALGAKLPDAALLPLVRGLPWNNDRAILLEFDNIETMIARLVLRAGAKDRILNTCLAILGAKDRQTDGPFEASLRESCETLEYAGLFSEKDVNEFTLPLRAAQIALLLSVDPRDASAYREVFTGYRQKFAAERKNTTTLTTKSKAWVCFYMLQALGNLKDQSSLELFRDVLLNDPKESADGLFKPVAVEIMRTVTPHFRAAAVYGLQRLGDTASVPALLDAVEDWDNSLAVRNTAAKALQTLCDAQHLNRLQKIAESYPEFETRRDLLQAVANLKTTTGPATEPPTNIRGTKMK